MSTLSGLAAQWNRADARFIRFLCVGALNTAFGYGIFAVAFWLTARPMASLIGATLVAILFNFATHGRMVFGSTHPSRLLPFAAGYGVSLALNIGLLQTLLLLGVPPLVAQAICLPFVVLVSYLINARLVFRTP